MKASESKESCCGTDCCGGVGEALKAGDRLKQAVKEHYSAVALRAPTEEEKAASGCGCGPECCGVEGPALSEDYAGLAGHEPEADLGLGCGLPTEAADLRPGDTVVDLGSGAGNDAFVARALVGAGGRVIGVDMTEAMIDKARRNNARLGYANVEFRLGDIEDLPLRDGAADVVISNCVLNLVPDKSAAFSESHRVLKPGGRLAVSDVVMTGVMPPELRADAEAYVGCLAGAMSKSDYLEGLEAAGFRDVKVVGEKEIPLPPATLARLGNPPVTQALPEPAFRILSVTVRAEKP